MRTLRAVLLSGMVLLLLVGGSPRNPPSGIPPAELKPVVDGNTGFALDLYARLKTRKGNLCLSPYSISSNLAVVYGGAKADTEAALSATMHFPPDQDQFHSAMSRINRTVGPADRANGIELTIANGMSDAFDPKRADFTGMTPKGPLFLDAVEHAAIVEVNEAGTVAAAATSSSIGCAASMPPPPAQFHADHPFLFLIRDNHTGTVLFLGRIADPSK